MEVQRPLGYEAVDREHENLGYDIEGRVPGIGNPRFIEVKGRVAGADTVTVTMNEFLYSLNKPEDFILANTPFDVSDWGDELQRDDNRWKYGVPPAGNVNFAWVYVI